MLKNAAKTALRTLGYDLKRILPEPPDDPVSDRTRELIRAMWPSLPDQPLVRFGGDRDGAYLIPDDLEGIEALFSPGIAEVSAFEDEMSARGMRCYLADASVAAPAKANAEFKFDKKFLGLRNNDTYFTIDNWVNTYEPGDYDLMLQMDIEGAEWTVLSNMSDRLLSRFRVMVVEFHSMSLLYDPYAEQILSDVLHRVLLTHRVVHNHPNNAMWINKQDGVEIPEVIEVTFLRKDRMGEGKNATEFPHPLDVISNPLKPVLVLPASWHA